MTQRNSDGTKKWPSCNSVSYHIRLPLNKLNHEILITKLNIIDVTNNKTKLGTTATEMMNCIHNTFGIRLKYNMQGRRHRGDRGWLLSPLPL
jgi:hypothetical protein